jgi:hypothetical protein
VDLLDGSEIPPTMTALPMSEPRPIRIDPAYDDPELPERVMRRRGTFELIGVDYSPAQGDSSAAGKRAPAGEQPSTMRLAWFREYWARDGVVLVTDAEPMFRNHRFVEAGRELFGFPVIRPVSLAVNLMGPMPGGNPHVDTPSYRGIGRGDAPGWLLMSMRSSGFFERWRLRPAAALSWLYFGQGGEFEYWPDGPGAASVVERPPFGNVALVSDSESMVHRVGAIGSEPEFVDSRALSRTAGLRQAAGEWLITDGDSVTCRLASRQVRISFLWRGLVLSEREAALLDSHEDDLSVDEVIGTISRDLGRMPRGTEPNEVFADPDWTRAVMDAYSWRQ